MFSGDTICIFTGLLQPHLYCPAWRHDVEENNDTRTQLTVFRSKGEYREVRTASTIMMTTIIYHQSSSTL